MWFEVNETQYKYILQILFKYLLAKYFQLNNFVAKLFDTFYSINIIFTI